MSVIHGIFHWLGYWTGVADESGKGYGFWSGFGSCLTYLTFVVAAWRHLNCHSRGCYRIGRHPVAGGLYKVCRHHHPDIPNRGATAEHIAAAHALHKQQGLPVNAQ